MRAYLPLMIFVALIAAVPLLTPSGTFIHALILTLYVALLGQAWNILGGFGGQFSFGHAVFFGTGAYAMALLQMKLGINAWLALPLAAACAAMVGAIIGALSFRYGLKGSYFALVTLAFAEVLRILANTFNFTGAGVGLQLPLAQEASQMQFSSKSGYLYLILGLFALAFTFAQWLKGARLGAWLTAVRDNEEAAQALGVNAFAVKLIACVISGAFMGLGGAFYVQYLQYIDPGIAYGPQVSVEALLAAIVGGMGTVWGPLLGAILLHVLGEATRGLFENAQGLSLVVYGVLLVVMVTFAPKGIVGLWQQVYARVGGGPGQST